MLTARAVCDLFRKYIKKNDLMELLFDNQDEEGNVALYYYSTKNPKNKVYYDPSFMSYDRLFDGESFTDKMKRIILNCEEKIWENIENTISIITDPDKFNAFFDELYDICSKKNLLLYLPEFDKSITDYQKRKEFCIQMAFAAFMVSAGKNIKCSIVLMSKTGINSDTFDNQKVRLIPPAEPDYFSQYITNENTGKPIVVFPEIIDNPDLRPLQEYSRILIKGPGGQGKSTFLYRLSCRAKSQGIFRNVIRIELAKLLSVTQSELHRFGQGDACPIRYILAGLYTDDGSNNELINHLQNYESAEGKDLLLLDGLNELYASSDIKKISEIKDELSYISKNWKNTIILITTRESEGDFSYKNCGFIDNYTICSLSSVPDALFNDFISRHPELDEKIKELAKIPLYFNTLNKLENTSEINSKYDVLAAIYKDRYKQTEQDYENFYAFYILAPLIAREISNSNGNHISRVRIEELIIEYSKCNFLLLSEVCQRECGMAVTNALPDYSKVVAILISNSGPLKFENDSDNLYKFFHDEIRDYVLSYGAYTSMQALKSGADKDYRYVKDIYADFNFRDEPAMLFKSKLGITKDCDLKETLGKFFNYTTNEQVTPAAILYAHTAFLISDYLSLGRSATEPVHKLLLSFTDTLVYQLKLGVFEELMEGLSEEDKIRCKYAVADIFSKHCEYYRITDQFEKGIELIEASKKLGCDTDTLKNQKAKLLILIYQQYIKTPDEVTVTPRSMGYATYEAMFAEGLRLQTEAAENNFNLSANLIVNLNSIPVPYLIENEVAGIKFDFVKAFLTAYSVVFTRKRNNYVVREIEYTARQAVALLIKGYVKVNPEMGYRTGYRLAEGQIVEGDKNTLDLSEDTLRLAEYILSVTEGTNPACLNYCRGIVSYYKKDTEGTKLYFDKEKDYNLKTVFSHYKLGITANLDEIYEGIKKAFISHKASIDACHPIYWYIDLKNLELSCNPNRAEFFDEFEKEMPEVWKRIVKQLTP